MKHNSYKVLALALLTHLIIMFSLTYSGVYRLNDIFINLNRFYMAVVMVAPMAILMLLFMGHMFQNKKLNLAIYASSFVVFVLAFLGIQKQLLVKDVQFLRSMIPHHSIAVKTCKQAEITDPEVIKLCEQIIESQEEEISQMRKILKEKY